MIDFTKDELNVLAAILILANPIDSLTDEAVEHYASILEKIEREL